MTKFRFHEQSKLEMKKSKLLQTLYYFKKIMRRYFTRLIYINCISIIIFFLLSANPISAQLDFWERTNGPCGGSLYNYAFDSAGIVYGGNENGIFKSTDGGYNWSYFGFQEKTVFGICKTSSGILLCGVSGEGMYRSTNEGLSWTLTLPTGYIPDILESGKGILLAGTNNGIFRSTDNGLNWVYSMSESAFSLAESPIDGAIYAATPSALYRSSNSGTSWTSVLSLQVYTLRGVAVSDNGYIYTADSKGSLSRSTDSSRTFTTLYKDSIYEPTCVAATSGSYVYCGTRYEGIWRSSDYGESWTIAGVGQDVNRIKRGIDDEIFASVPSHGCVKTTDNGLTWTESLKGIVNIYSGPLIMTKNGSIYSSSGQTSFDNGLNWLLFSNPIIVSYSIAVDNDSGYIYLSNGRNQIHRSTDNGSNFSSFNVSQNVNDYATLVVTHNDEIFASGLNLYKSTNRGVNWVYISDQGFRSFAVNKENYYFGSDDAGVYRSTNSGQNWTFILSLAHNTLYPYNPLMVTTDDVIYAGGTEGIFRSSDDGANWIKDADINNVSFLIQGSNGKIFASCYNFFSVNEGGVYFKDGNSWQNITYDLNRKNVLSMCFNQNGQMLVSTAGSGVFRSVDPVIGINQISNNFPADYILYQNFPNPFNPSTKIKFDVPSVVKHQRTEVSIVVYDLIGREVVKLVNETLETGRYEVEFDGSDLPSGIYLYRFTAGNFTETKRMVLVR